MHETIGIYDYLDNFYDTGVLFDAVKEIDVHVLTGDEVIYVTYKDKRPKLRLDSANFSHKPRLFDFDDGFYTVEQADFEEWNRRTDSYDWLNREQEKEDA